MALPTTLYVPVDDFKHKFSAAANVSRKPVRCFDRDVRRDTIDAAYLGNAHNTLGTTGSTVSLAGGAEAVVQNSTAFADASFQEGDEYNHIWPRQTEKLRTMVQFWSGAIGHAMTLTVDTTSGSATIIVPDNELLTPGQLISGTGIPTGARILSVLVPEAASATNHNFSRTKVILSHQCTATASVEATLTGSDLLGWVWDDEHKGWSQEPSILE